jgi:CheY-like chemotaxis protein
VSRILLVEDNELNRDMLRRRLQKRGFSMLTANDGRQGIDRARAEMPDLILMDLNLPEVDGWEAATALKGDLRTSRIPIIALTAHAMVSDKEKALEHGCDDFATKPVDFETLLTKIHTLLSRNSGC